MNNTDLRKKTFDEVMDLLKEAPLNVTLFIKKSISIQFNGSMPYFKGCGLPLEHFELVQEPESGVVVANITNKIPGMKASGYYAVVGIGDNSIKKYKDGEPVEAKKKKASKKKKLLFEEAKEMLENVKE